MSLTVSISFFRFGPWRDRAWALGMMGAARLAMPNVPDIGFWKLCGSGTGQGFTPVPNTAVYAILATWPSADIARKQIYNLAAWQVLEVGKQWDQAYADVGEAVDFLEYYGREMIRLGKSKRWLQDILARDAKGERRLQFHGRIGRDRVWNEEKFQALKEAVSCREDSEEPRGHLLPGPRSRGRGTAEPPTRG